MASCLVVVAGGHSPKFIRNCRYVEICMEEFIGDIPGCVYDASKNLRLEALNCF